MSATVHVPRRFTRSLLTKLGEDRHAQTRVDVLMEDDGSPRLARFTFIAPADGLSPNELRRPDLHGLLWWAVDAQIFHELQMVRLETDGVHFDGGGAYLELEDEELHAMYVEAQAIRRARGPYRITDEFLLGVLGQHRQGGVKLIAKENDVSERTARRWLREARERGLR